MSLSELPSPNRHPQLRHYLADVQAWHGYIRFVGMSIYQSNPDIPLDDLYVGQSISRYPIKPEQEPKAEDLYNPSKLLAEQKRLVVLGDPGSGKSTLVNYYCWFLSSGLLETLPNGLDKALPLPLVLRDLDLSQVERFDDIIEAFLRRPVADKLKDHRPLLTQYLEAGRVLVLIDGLDEVDSRHRQSVREAILQGFEQYPECYFLCTSRIVGYDEAPLGTAKGLMVPEFSRLHQPSQQQRPFKYEPELYYMAPMTKDQIHHFAQQWYVNQGDSQSAAHLRDAFVKAVAASKTTESLARTPNLLTMMALIFKNRSELPNGQALLYEHIAQAYLESIDTARGLKDPIPWHKKKIWLARVGFEMQLRREDGPTDTTKLLTTGEDILAWIKAAMTDTGDRHDDKYAEKYLDWIAKRSGLLLPRGENQYAFMHLSFQEYFAAVYIKHQLQNPAWLDPEEDDDSGLDKRVTKQEINNWTLSYSWHQTLIYLFELFDGQPGWAKRLWRLCSQMPEVSNEDKLQIARFSKQYLCAEILCNPHSGLRQDIREKAIEEFAERLFYPMGWKTSLDPSGDNYSLATLFLDAFLNFSMLQQAIINKAKALAECGKLHGLRFNGFNTDNSEQVIRELVGVVHPTYLSLSSTNIQTLDFLGEQEQLETLYLIGTKVKDLAPLSSLPNLKKVLISKDQPIDTSTINPAIITRI